MVSFLDLIGNGRRDSILKLLTRRKRMNFKCDVKRFTPTAKLPVKTHQADSGYDIFVDRIEEDETTLKAFSGIGVTPDATHWFMMVPRSSTYKRGLILYNSVGIIDNLYTGELVGIFKKTELYKESPKVGDRLLQLVPQEFIQCGFTEVDELSQTARGDGGHGSTGK